MRISQAVIACILCGAALAADAGPERTFTRSVAQVEAALKTLPGGSAGPLPVIDGFVASSVANLNQYQRPYYKCTVTVSPSSSGGSLVRVTAKITAWRNGGAKSGYEVLPSNGRLESDLLDRLQQALSASGGTPVSTGDSTLKAENKPARSDQPTIDAPTMQFPRRLEPKMPPQNAATDDPALQREADSLSEILRNQSHPSNLVAVKKDQTPMLQTPSLDGKVLFLASAEDEFEVIEQNSDWVHVRISGLSRGWLRRSAVQMPDDLDHAATSPEAGVATQGAAGQKAMSESRFSVSSEETGNFPGDWAPLKAKRVNIVSVQAATGVGATSGEDKLKFAEEMFKKQSLSGTSEGLVVVFDTEDGGMIAATGASIERYKKGALSEDAFWKQCYVDPPEILGNAQ